VRILGTSAESIDRAEDRHKFSSLCDQIELDQPRWTEYTGKEDLGRHRRGVGLSHAGAAFVRALRRGPCGWSGPEHLEAYLRRAALVSPDHPVVITRFETGSKEIEIDAVATTAAWWSGRWPSTSRTRRALRRRHPGDPAPEAVSGNRAAHQASHPAAGRRVGNHRAVQHPVLGQEQPDQDHRVQPARLALGALRVQGRQAQLHRRGHPIMLGRPPAAWRTAPWTWTTWWSRRRSSPFPA